MAWVPSWELTYPPSKGLLKVYFPFLQVGYVSSLEDSQAIRQGLRNLVLLCTFGQTVLPMFGQSRWPKGGNRWGIIEFLERCSLVFVHRWKFAWTCMDADWKGSIYNMHLQNIGWDFGSKDSLCFICFCWRGEYPLFSMQTCFQKNVFKSDVGVWGWCLETQWGQVFACRLENLYINMLLLTSNSLWSMPLRNAKLLRVNTSLWQWHDSCFIDIAGNIRRMISSSIVNPKQISRRTKQLLAWHR